MGRAGCIADAARAAGLLPEGEGFDADGPADDGNPMGTLESEINYKFDVGKYEPLKRAAMKCHASQLSDSSFFLAMDDETVARQFGNEWFIDPKSKEPMRDGWIFE